jgi:hypothetical protein
MKESEVPNTKPTPVKGKWFQVKNHTHLATGPKLNNYNTLYYSVIKVGKDKLVYEGVIKKKK